VESAKGECNLGQHEIAFLYDSVLRTCDNHVIYKNAAKEIAANHGQSLTFMAKFDEREGNSCHIHLSLRGTDGQIVFADDEREGGRSTLFEHFVAGVQATMREFTLLYAPNVNSYKRFQPGSFAPTAVAWGTDNRTCALRVVGHGAGLRVENRVPGGDVNPYLAVAGMLAGGLHGIREELPLEPAFGGNAYASDKARVPSLLSQGRDLFAGSAVARAAFGDDVVEHYAHAAQVELDAFNAAVTDWERIRGFERL
jgi:glutamine synthetase